MKKLPFISIIIFVLSGCSSEPTQYVGGFPTMVVYEYASDIDNSDHIEELLKRSEKNDYLAQYELGSIYYDGIGGKRSHQLALKYWLMSAENGYVPAEYSVGHLYLFGHGINLDFKEGCRWLKKAYEKNHYEAKVLYKKRCNN